MIIKCACFPVYAHTVYGFIQRGCSFLIFFVHSELVLLLLLFLMMMMFSFAHFAPMISLAFASVYRTLLARTYRLHVCYIAHKAESPIISHRVCGEVWSSALRQ